MGFYSVVNRALMAAGQPEDITQVVANLDAIAAILNGGLDDTNVNAAAAIQRSKLNFGAGLVNSDIAAAAAIADTKLAGLAVMGADINAGSANTDVAWDGGGAVTEYRRMTPGGGSIRSIAAPTRGVGTRLVLRNTHTSAVTMLHATAGGTGAQLSMLGGNNGTAVQGDTFEFLYDGTNWVEVDRDLAAMGAVGATHLGQGGSVAAAVTANTAYLCPLPSVYAAQTYTRMIWGLVTLVAGNYDVGVYYSDDEATFTRLTSKGSTAQPAAGNIITAMTSFTITPATNRRWFTGIAFSSGSSILGVGAGAAQPSGVPAYSKATSFPLPASLTGMTAIGATWVPNATLAV